MKLETVNSRGEMDEYPSKDVRASNMISNSLTLLKLLDILTRPIFPFLVSLLSKLLKLPVWPLVLRARVTTVEVRHRSGYTCRLAVALTGHRDKISHLQQKWISKL